MGPIADLQKKLESVTAGEYDILDHLGSGGMGAVFLALDLSLHRHVAIKVMAPALIQDGTMLERFRTEARIVATLRHPGIVNIHGFRMAPDLCFFVMDFVEGATLRSVIRAHGPLPVEVVQAVMYDVGSALRHAHSREGGIIHRDVKPSNIILEPRGHAIVMDFGISKAANARSGLTMTGTVVGTPEYMSPEQCRGGQITAASDQYSLGLVAYAMLTGAPPFTGQHWRVLAQQTTADPTPVRQLRPQCPRRIADTVERMIAKSVRDRFPDTLSAVRAMGGTPFEDGAPVRLEIGRLVERAGGGRKAATPVVALAIEGLSEEIERGDVLSITVTPLDGVGRALEGRRYTVESTNPSVLEVMGTDTLRAIEEGSAEVVARCGTALASRPLRVTRPVVASVRIASPEGPIRVGDRVAMRASLLDRRGAQLPERTVVWASSDPEVADVSSDGLLHARGVGRTTIFATSEGQSTTLELEVIPAERRPAADLRPRATTPSPSTTQAPALRGIRALWMSAVVLLLVAGGLWGYPRLLALLDPPPPAATEAPSPASVTVLSNGATVAEAVALQVGDTMLLEARPLDGDGEPLAASVAWRSADPSVARVDGLGRLLAIAPGETTVVARAGIAEGTIRARVLEPAPPTDAQVTASVAGASPEARPPLAGGQPAVARLSISRRDGGNVQDGLRLEIGSSMALRVAPLDSAGRTLSGVQPTWSSSDALVATVDASGVLRGLREGSAIVRAAAAGAAQDIEVAVVAPAPGTLIVTVRPWAYVSIDGMRQGEDQRRLEVSLPPGEHELRLENPALSTFDTTVVIRSGETTSVDKLLTSGGGG